MSITYLIKNRSRPPILSLKWFRIWAKRGYHLPGLFRILIERLYLIICGAKIGQMTIVECAFKIRSPRNLVVGAHSFIARDAVLALHKRVVIGNYAVISPGATLLTASHSLSSNDWAGTAAEIHVKSYAWVATNAIVLQGVTVGEGAVVAAGAAIGKDVPDYALAIGNPQVNLLDRRVRQLHYDPVALCGPYQAWLGG